MTTRETDGTTPRRRGGPRPRLTREDVGSAALDLADRDGIDAVTMRGLAEALGVGTMTLYGYVEGRDDLLDAAVDVATAGATPPPSDGPWRERLGGVVRVAWKMLERHPALVEIRLRRPVLRPEALRFGEAVMAILRAEGFDAGEAAELFRLLFTYTLGYAALSPQRTAEAARREAAAVLASLPPETHPELSRARAEVATAMAGTAAFERGLECILDGIAARARGLPPPGEGAAC